MLGSGDIENEGRRPEAIGMIRYVKLVGKTGHCYLVHRRFLKKDLAGRGQGRWKILTHESVGHGTHQRE